MSGECPDCGNTMCICDLVEKQNLEQEIEHLKEELRYSEIRLNFVVQTVRPLIGEEKWKKLFRF